MLCIRREGLILWWRWSYSGTVHNGMHLYSDLQPAGELRGWESSSSVVWEQQGRMEQRWQNVLWRSHRFQSSHRINKNLIGGTEWVKYSKQLFWCCWSPLSHYPNCSSMSSSVARNQKNQAATTSVCDTVWGGVMRIFWKRNYQPGWNSKRSNTSALVGLRAFIIMLWIELCFLFETLDFTALWFTTFAIIKSHAPPETAAVEPNFL